MTEPFHFFVLNNAFVNSRESAQLVLGQIPDHPSTVTVIIPTYRRCSLLKAAIDSVLSQEGFNDFSIVIIDNDNDPNSNTEALLRSYQSRHILYYKNKCNLGQISNWNMGVLLASSEWVILLHDDDQLLPDYMQSVMTVVNDSPYWDGLFTVPITRSTAGKSRIALRRSSALKKCFNRVRLCYKKRKSGLVSELSPRDYYYDCGYTAPIAPIYRRQCLLDMGGFAPEAYPISDWVLHVNFCRRFKLGVLARTCCVRGVGANESLKTESKLGFLRQGKLFREAMRSEFGFFRGDWWIQSALWYHAIMFYSLAPDELSVCALDKKYNKRRYRLLYQLLVYAYSFFKPYCLQTELEDEISSKDAPA